MRMHKGYFPGIFLLCFTGLACAMAFMHLGQAMSGTGLPAKGEVRKGEWMPKFEKTLGEKLPVYEPSRKLWGAGEFLAFGQGRKGVVVGKDGWLFTDEEFSCPKGSQTVMDEHLTFMKDVQSKLQQKNVELAVVLLPAKTRIFRDHTGDTKIPACREKIYTDTLNYLRGQNIETVNVLGAMEVQPQHDNLFLKTDTHWTPEGAKLAALAAAQSVSAPEGSEKAFFNKPVKIATHEGDLLRYLPGVDEKKVPRDQIQEFATESGDEKQSDDLFGDAAPPITLVGTSYSANPKWNFEGFLKEVYQSDILNMADDGQGPFTVMEKYLEDDAWKNSPPKLVLWEVPERYLTIKDKINEELH